MTIMNWFTEPDFKQLFSRKGMVVAEPSTMRTVNPGDGRVAGLLEHTKPSSRVDVLKIIEDNVQNELESIEHEMTTLNARLIELKDRQRRYFHILEAAKSTE